MFIAVSQVTNVQGNHLQKCNWLLSFHCDLANKKGDLSAHWWCCWIDLSMIQKHTEERMKMYEELVIVRYIWVWLKTYNIVSTWMCESLWTPKYLYNNTGIHQWSWQWCGLLALKQPRCVSQVEHWQSKLYVWATSNLNFSTPEGILCLVGFGSWYLRRFTVPTVGQSWRCVGSPRLIRTWNSPQRETLCVKIFIGGDAKNTSGWQFHCCFNYITIFRDTW